MRYQERMREMPAFGHIYNQWKVPIGNEESQSPEQNAEEEHMVNKYEQEERE